MVTIQSKQLHANIDEKWVCRAIAKISALIARNDSRNTQKRRKACHLPPSQIPVFFNLSFDGGGGNVVDSIQVFEESHLLKVIPLTIPLDTNVNS